MCLLMMTPGVALILTLDGTTCRPACVNGLTLATLGIFGPEPPSKRAKRAGLRGAGFRGVCHEPKGELFKTVLNLAPSQQIVTNVVVDSVTTGQMLRGNSEAAA